MSSYGVHVLRYAMARRWIPWHCLCLVVISALIGLGVWQWMVSTAPDTVGGPPAWNLRNLVYALQWWAFACFAIWFWLRFMRDERDSELAAAAQPVVAAASEGPAEAQPEQISLDAPAAERLRRHSTLPGSGSATER